MTEQREIRRIFIGSPGDLTAERHLFQKVIEEVNNIKANSMSIMLEALGWEDTLPGRGRPQEIINEDVKKSDLVVLIIWKRWGTPTGKYSSGFEEEYELAKSLNKKNNGVPHIMLYFKSIPDDMLSDAGPQLSKVLEFRSKIENEKQFLYKPFETSQEWEGIFKNNICRWLDGIKPMLIDPHNNIEYLNRIEKLEKELKDSKLKECKNAEHWAKEAENHANNGRLTNAEECFARAIASYPFPYIINNYGLFLHSIGMYKKAEEKFKRVLNIGIRDSNSILKSAAYTNLGGTFETLGDLEKAEKMHRNALKIDQDLEHKGRLAKDYGNLGLIYHIRGESKKAKDMLKKSLEISEELHLEEGMAINYGNLGALYRDTGDFAKSEKMFIKSFELNKKNGRKQGMALQCYNLGSVYTIQGYLEKAEIMAKKSLRISKAIGYKAGIANGHACLGVILMRRGDIDGAEKKLEKARGFFEEIGSKLGLASGYGILGEIYVMRKNFAKAKELYKKSLAINKELGRKRGMAAQLFNLGELYEMRGDIDKAKNMFKESLQFYTEIAAKPDIEDAKARLKRLEEVKKKSRKKK